MPIYLDCNATTPVDPRVHELILQTFGNAGSRTHAFGNQAQKAVQNARDHIAACVDAKRDEILFTSGATEANNLAILGLAKTRNTGHIISTAIEHKAVSEPIDHLEAQGFKVTRLPPTPGGWLDPNTLAGALTPDTFLVSVMAANNETGIVQPLQDIANALKDHPAYLHTDAAQTFGKDNTPLQNKRIDLISLSAHKCHGPQGVGALIARRRGFLRPPLSPLMYGGGQERGLRPGTLPVPLIVAFAHAAKLAHDEAASRRAACRAFRTQVLEAFTPLEPVFHGDPERCMAHVLNLALPGLDSEAVMLALKSEIAISNGSACTSQSYEPSHVLQAMGLSEESIAGALRISWCHMTESPDWAAITSTLQALR